MPTATFHQSSNRTPRRRGKTSTRCSSSPRRQERNITSALGCINWGLLLADNSISTPGTSIFLRRHTSNSGTSQGVRPPLCPTLGTSPDPTLPIAASRLWAVGAWAKAGGPFPIRYSKTAFVTTVRLRSQEMLARTRFLFFGLEPLAAELEAAKTATFPSPVKMNRWRSLM